MGTKFFMADQSYDILDNLEHQADQKITPIIAVRSNCQGQAIRRHLQRRRLPHWHRTSAD